jgi:hypothetical protein
MNLDTYRSTKIAGVFVTLPSNEGRAIIGLVDELAMLSLDPVRLEYEVSESGGHADFARFVLTEIVSKGYATHGEDGFPLLPRDAPDDVACVPLR